MLPEPYSHDARLPWEGEFEVHQVRDESPGLSVVIPVYNAGSFIEKTIRSLLCNELDGVEIIVADGGSNDNTQEILAHYRDYFFDVISEPDNGQSDAINKGFSKATQPILYWLNGDDVILPGVLTDIRHAFRDDPSANVVVGDAYMTEADFTPIRHATYSDAQLAFSHLIDYAPNHLIQPSVFFTRRAWEASGPVAEDLHYAMDADLFLSMAEQFDFKHVPVDVAYSVYHEDCKTRGKRAESISELSLVQAKHGGFREARKTLNILVDLFNDLVEKSESTAGVPQGEREDPDSPCPNCQVMAAKLEAQMKEVDDRKRLLLDRDLEVTE